ncbi:hypothetical protein SAMN05519104_1843 [Rhizobiales bacterium GAS188]|nr:hypothetical protein SAMN05519104_1843 [Rhizobiales bacterium GAS188]
MPSEQIRDADRQMLIKVKAQIRQAQDADTVSKEEICILLGSVLDLIERNMKELESIKGRIFGHSSSDWAR